MVDRAVPRPVGVHGLEGFVAGDFFFGKAFEGHGSVADSEVNEVGIERGGSA